MSDLVKEQTVSLTEFNILKEKFFELAFAMDNLSASRDLVGLRRKHYDNQQWIHDNGLQEDYYQYFVSQLKTHK